MKNHKRLICLLLASCIVLGAQVAGVSAQPSTVNVMFDANGGNPATQTVDAVIGETYGTLFAQIQRPERLGGFGLSPDMMAQFIGWFTTPSGSGVQFHASDIITESSPRTLYARWRGLVTLDTISFYGNGGVPKLQGISTHQVAGATFAEAFALIDEPTKDGYVFAGWFTLRDGGRQILPIEGFSAFWGPLEARWEPILPPTVDLTFAGNGGTPDNQRTSTQMGNTFAQVFEQIEAPRQAGFEFIGWFTAPTGGTQVVASHVVTEARTIYAQWRPVTTPTPPPNDLPFTDTPAHWAHDAIRFVFERDLMTGKSATTFAPDATLSRAMVATILYRMAGEPAVAFRPVFGDVPADEWFSDAVVWAYDAGIVQGVGGGLFAPNDAVTREQFAVMLWRYAGADDAVSAQTAFPDVDQISDWAEIGKLWAIGNGFIQGTDAGTLNPQGTATRAEAATIVQRFMAG